MRNSTEKQRAKNCVSNEPLSNTGTLDSADTQ
jgi:hypothetical protein